MNILLLTDCSLRLILVREWPDIAATALIREVLPTPGCPSNSTGLPTCRFRTLEKKLILGFLKQGKSLAVRNRW